MEKNEFTHCYAGKAGLDNHKRVRRVYREEGLNLRSKRPHRLKAAAHRMQRPEVSTLDQCWSMDFV